MTNRGGRRGRNGKPAESVRSETVKGSNEPMKKPRLHYLQHVPFEGPGCIRNWAEASGFPLAGSRLYQPHRLPAMEQFDWLVIMGGPMNVDEELRYPWMAAEKAFIGRAIEAGKVVLGICLGGQLIADVLGARVTKNRYKEIGWYPVCRTASPAQLPHVAAIENSIDALHWHGDTFDLPDGAVHLARSEGCENQAFVYDERVLALQFHLEMTAGGLQDLVNSCGREIEPGPYMQSPAVMLADPGRFQAANRIMHRLLDGLAGLSAA